MYDSEIGRWLSVDPARQFASPYVGMGNGPIIGVDPDGQYSRFGAWWRSLYIRDSYTYNVGGDEWAIGWSEWRQDDQGAYLYTYSITEGGPGIGKESFEGLAFDAGFNFELSLGAQKVRDYGLTGFDVNLGSATLFEFKPQLSWEYGKGWEGSRLGINYFGKDNKVKITQGIKYEGGVDLKANAVYEYDLVNGKLTRINNSFGIGAPGIEGKFTHDKVHGIGKVRVGLQEDVGRSIPVGAGLELGLRSGAYIRGGFNAK